jgi:mono/diheme cytochrome c family protein
MTIRKRIPALSIALGVFAFGAWFWPQGATSPTLAQGKGSEWESAFEKTIRPLLRDHCLKCHSTEKHKGDLDLERFATVSSIKQHTDVWEHVLDQLATGEMPPKSSPQLSAEQKQQLTKWVRETLNEVALANAGDPGPVVLRRLSNHEYTYTIRDLTGIPTLDPAREFPVDGAAGEGFTNSGAALVMSPALLQKYLDAAKEVSRHAVLLPDGIRFSASNSAQDWTSETLAQIRAFYARHTTVGEGSLTVQQGIPLDVGTGGGRLPLARYLDALQGRGKSQGLSTKYLEILRTTLTAKAPSVLLDPLRAKFAARQLTAADIEAWQKVLWRFSNIGHIGRANGPKAWQEPVSPLVSQQELRAKLNGDHDHTLYLVSGTAGDGDVGDSIVWDNPRLVAKGRPDLPIDQLPELVKHLEAERTKILASTESCLTALSGGKSDADPKLVALWRNYLGLGSTKLEPLLTKKLERSPDYAFIKGWVGASDLSVLANSSDARVRIPGVMTPHSIATHPAPDRASVIAWKSPVATANLKISGTVTHAHPECGNGVTWALEVRRGNTTERLAAGLSQGARPIKLGPFANVGIGVDQVVALIIGPRDGNHACDLTAVNLTLTDDKTTWDLANDVSPNILTGNPHGPWHFLSQPAAQDAASELPAPMANWRKKPSSELAAKVREHLEKDFPLTHPLLAQSLRSFQATGEKHFLKSQAPATMELKIPAALAKGAEFVVTARLEKADEGSVQAQVLTQKPATPVTSAMPGLPIIVGDGSPARRRFEQEFEDFRKLFPIALCYTRIVPVDEVVTLTLFYREDDHLRRLILSDAEIRELDRMWAELLFVSETPLKQVVAFEQIYQFATQDRPDLVKEFDPLREPIKKAAAEFKKQKEAAESAQRQAVIEFAAKAWRRPLTEQEIADLKQYPPRLMLVRVLTSPVFLYRGEKSPEHTGPVNDWELATRLSYFLWSSPPDEELRKLAAAGKLRAPDVLASQARRMLKDDRIRRLATEFGCQWLHVRDLATLNEKSERHFPTFASVREDMQEEVTRFFIDLFQNDRSVLELLDADHTFVNKALADHYGLKTQGTDWQRVDGLREKGRGGILGFGATLAKHSGASRTSAILRGTWVSEVVLGDKLPKPPNGVPILPDEAPSGLTERQLIERHTRDANCAACHKRIDPYGFALEGFDAIGKSRKADTKTTLLDGTHIDGLGDLRDYILKNRKRDFLKQFNRKLLGYSLGRSVRLSDQPLLDTMVQSDGQRVADLVEQIVRSRQFREIRGQSSDRNQKQ